MNTIYVFTGTGNSLAVAKELMPHLPNTEIRSITGGIKPKKEMIPQQSIGFVFPAYYFDAPKIVKSFLSGNDFNPNAYYYALVTCGDNPGYALNTIQDELHKKGCRLGAGFTIKLADNSIAYQTKDSVLYARNKKLPETISNIADVINTKQLLPLDEKRTPVNKLKAAALVFGTKKIIRINKKKYDSGRCDGCGLCAKVCPMQIIQTEKGGPAWRGECADCFACINWCPQKAISFGLINTKKNSQYRHAQTGIKEIIDFNKRKITIT